MTNPNNVIILELVRKFESSAIGLNFQDLVENPSIVCVLFSDLNPILDVDHLI